MTAVRKDFPENIQKKALTVLAGLVLIITEGTVESSQLTQLVALELVLAFGNRSGLKNCVNIKSRRDSWNV
jgi:2-keto-3-deoxy-6-phosphogluconate aldolase